MSGRAAAINRRMVASREGTPIHSRVGTPIPSRVASRVGTPSHSRVPSRAGTPTHSRLISPSPSREALNGEGMYINAQDNLSPPPPPTNQNTNFLLPPSGDSRGDVHGRWSGSSGNLTSTDSTPSSDHTHDSGQATDSSQLTAPLDTLGFSPSPDGTNAAIYRMPIIGYEVLEKRSRFTVFKIQVFHQPMEEHWFVFRRYTDFVRLNRALVKEFPGLRFALPPKRWFGDNFDPIFLEDRQLGLQAFINNIISHPVIREKKCVRDFFCLDDPLSSHNTLEESRAMCQVLENNVSDLQELLREKDGELTVLRSQVNFLMVQQQALVKALRMECEMKASGNYEQGSTHDLNLALLNICEKTLNGSLPVDNASSSEGNGMRHTSRDSSPARKFGLSAQVESPLRRTLERAFFPRSGSHNTLSPNHCLNMGANGNSSGEEGDHR